MHFPQQDSLDCVCGPFHSNQRTLNTLQVNHCLKQRYQIGRLHRLCKQRLFRRHVPHHCLDNSIRLQNRHLIIRINMHNRYPISSMTTKNHTDQPANYDFPIYAIDRIALYTSALVSASPSHFKIFNLSQLTTSSPPISYVWGQ